MKAITTDNLSSDFTLDIKSKKIKINKGPGKAPITNNYALGPESIVNKDFHMFAGGLRKKQYEDLDRMVVMDKDGRLAVIDYHDNPKSEPITKQFAGVNLVDTNLVLYSIGSAYDNSKNLAANIYFHLYAEKHSDVHSVIVEMESDENIQLANSTSNPNVEYTPSEDGKKLTIEYKFPDAEVAYPRPNPHSTSLIITLPKASYLKYKMKSARLPSDDRPYAERYAEVENNTDRVYELRHYGGIRLPYQFVNDNPHGKFRFSLNPREEGIRVKGRENWSTPKPVTLDSDGGTVLAINDLSSAETDNIVTPYRKYVNAEFADFINLMDSISLKGKSITIPDVRNIRVMTAGNGKASAESDIYNPKMLNIIQKTGERVQGSENPTETYRTWRFHRNINDYSYIPIHAAEANDGCTYKDGKLTFNGDYSSALVFVTFNGTNDEKHYYANQTMCFKLATRSKDSSVTATFGVQSIVVSGLDSKYYSYADINREFLTNERTDEGYQLKFEHLYSNEAYDIGLNMKGDFRLYTRTDPRFDGYHEHPSLRADKFVKDTNIDEVEKVNIRLETGKAYKFDIVTDADLPMSYGMITIKENGEVTVSEQADENDNFATELLSFEFTSPAPVEDPGSHEDSNTDDHSGNPSEVRDDE